LARLLLVRGFGAFVFLGELAGLVEYQEREGFIVLPLNVRSRHFRRFRRAPKVPDDYNFPFEFAL
jgi:hypothetical protein